MRIWQKQNHEKRKKNEVRKMLVWGMEFEHTTVFKFQLFTSSLILGKSNLYFYFYKMRTIKGLL